MLIDTATFDRFQEAKAKAVALGLPLIEVLDREELLLTVRQRHNIGVTAMEDLIRRLDRQTPNKLMSFYYGRVDGTPAEMFAALQMWLSAVCRHQANKTLEDL